MKLEFANLEALAQRFNQTLLAIPKDQRGGTPFDEYPMGCCDYTTLMFRIFLRAQGDSSFAVARGGKPAPNPHAADITHFWLQSDQWIADITLHQFEEMRNMPLVLPASSAFHRTFTRDRSIDHSLEKEQYLNLEHLQLLEEVKRRLER